MLRFSFSTAVTVTVVAKKSRGANKLQSLERACSGIDRVSAGI